MLVPLLTSMFFVIFQLPSIMTQLLREKLNDSPTARWTALVIVAITMMLGYFVAKEMSPLEDLLELPTSQGGLGWTSSEYGFFAGSRSFFNVFFFMLFIGGLILDRMGVRFTGLLSCSLMVAGVGVNYYAIEFMSPQPTTFVDIPLIGSYLGLNNAYIKNQVLTAAMGFAIFGVGYEMCGITVSKVMVKWFTGHEMALAMGIQVAMARFGTGAALLCCHSLAQNYRLSTPIFFGLMSVCIGLMIYMVYCLLDVKFDRERAQVHQTYDETSDNKEDEKFHFADLFTTLRNPGFWLITLLCLLYYSALYPFLDFATKIMIYKYGVDPAFAGAIPSVLPFSTIVFTPLFGTLYDRKGQGATLMILGTTLMTTVIFVFTLPINSSAVAIVLMVILGLAFSLLPSAMWPSVPKIIPMKGLGTAYSIIFYIQNIGLIVVPMLVGKINEENTVNGQVDFTPAMWIFTAIGAMAIVVSVSLFLLDKKKHYGLQQANIK